MNAGTKAVSKWMFGGYGARLALLVVAGLAGVAAPGRAELPRYLTTSYCHGEGTCVLITMTVTDKATGDFGKVYDKTTWVERVGLIFTRPCTYGLTAGGTKTISDQTVYEVEPGRTQFVREWRVPAGCRYQVALQSEKAGSGSFELDSSVTNQEVCVRYDINAKQRYGSPCQ